MRRLLWVVAALACGVAPPVAAPVAPAPVAQIETTVWLVGDAGGAAPEGDPVLAAVAAAVAGGPASHVVVFLGDNVYPRGLPDSTAGEFPEAARRLDAQLTAARGASRIFFVPGNHDWAKHGRDGWNAVRRQGQYIAAHGVRATMLPADGCPGPGVADVGARLRLVMLDTQWWLHGGPKPGPGSSCDADTPEEIEAALGVAVGADTTRHVLVLAHHPLMASGSHGGNFTLQDHLFPLTRLVPWLWLPLPVLGSAYPVARQLGVSNQDLAGADNRRMRGAFDRAMTVRRPLAYAGGHEHALEVHRGTVARYVFVSGAGNFDHTTRVGRDAETLFARAASGFMRVDVLGDGRVRLGVMVVDRQGRAEEVFALWLT